jgi:hypothetical protein
MKQRPHSRPSVPAIQRDDRTRSGGVLHVEPGQCYESDTCVALASLAGSGRSSTVTTHPAWRATWSRRPRWPPTWKPGGEWARASPATRCPPGRVPRRAELAGRAAPDVRADRGQPGHERVAPLSGVGAFEPTAVATPADVEGLAPPAASPASHAVAAADVEALRECIKTETVLTLKLSGRTARYCSMLSRLKSPVLAAGNLCTST